MAPRGRPRGKPSFPAARRARPPFHSPYLPPPPPPPPPGVRAWGDPVCREGASAPLAFTCAVFAPAPAVATSGIADWARTRTALSASRVVDPAGIGWAGGIGTALAPAFAACRLAASPQASAGD